VPNHETLLRQQDGILEAPLVLIASRRSGVAITHGIGSLGRCVHVALRRHFVHHLLSGVNAPFT